MTHKKIVAVDIDDVLVPHFGELAKFASEEFGIRLTDHEMFYAGTVNAIIERSGLSRDEIIDRIDAYLISDDFYIDPLPEAIEVLSKLVKYYNLVIVTARPQPMKDPTVRWLEKHFPKLFSEVHVVGHERWGLGAAPKGEVLQKLQVDILIDDHPTHCETATKQGIRALLFGVYPWTDSQTLAKKVEHVENWSEVAEKLLPTNKITSTAT